MATKKKSASMKFLDKLIGEPLTFAGMIRNVRETDGYTLASMGKKLGCSAQFLSDVERARRSVSPKLAARWAKALGYHPVVWVQHALQAEQRLGNDGKGCRHVRRRPTYRPSPVSSSTPSEMAMRRSKLRSWSGDRSST